jgi:hypothetical protein
MTPEQEIERIKKDYQEHWHLLKDHAGIISAIKNKNTVKLGETAAMVVTDWIHGHRVLVYVKGIGMPKGFASIELANCFITNQKSKIDFILAKNEYGQFREVK